MELFCVQSFISKGMLMQLALHLGSSLLTVVKFSCPPWLPVRCKALHSNGRLWSPAQKGETGSLEVTVFSP